MRRLLPLLVLLPMLAALGGCVVAPAPGPYYARPYVAPPPVYVQPYYARPYHYGYGWRRW